LPKISLFGDQHSVQRGCNRYELPVLGGPPSIIWQAGEGKKLIRRSGREGLAWPIDRKGSAGAGAGAVPFTMITGGRANGSGAGVKLDHLGNWPGSHPGTNRKEGGQSLARIG